MDYKFLLFDLDHTLFDFELAEEKALTLLLKEANVNDISSYMAYYKPMNKAMWVSLSKKEITKEVLVKTRFANLFAHFNRTEDGLFWAKRYEYYLGQQGDVYPFVTSLLERLTKENFQLYAVTNGITAIQENRLHHSPISHFFKQVFISDKIGHHKPDIAFFNHVATAIDAFKAREALVIGDNLLADIKGGIDAGIDTVWYNPDNKVNTLDIQPTFEIKSLEELLSVVLNLDKS
ncbi:YjjG family noncanonical pyrimidine nucleotidase [Streptococcus sp. CSL10205-OR2]|uniref:YjjG family noncanonical pyrimidine nucleotidase n=1 Tax=Streptococcus sp. CSL10205-OR2 TaxID=2980558 RepID=UPI0021D977FC|nr:YjjG family noncanonical pyrimidine nucleotidase [Streptococcus sp. CSL10205-OR2]MCU9533589.1 YjjG family noncanonical pyrimidine nucleotidase [Streptococcus sp. CSL10205-OR2]